MSCEAWLYLPVLLSVTGFFRIPCRLGITANEGMTESVRVENLDGVTVVTLDRPEVRTAVDAATARSLYDAFVAFEEDAQARVAVFHGAHGHFCAGWDLPVPMRKCWNGPGKRHRIFFLPAVRLRPCGPPMRPRWRRRAMR